MIGSRGIRFTLALVIATLTLVAATSLTAQALLTNDSLVALKKAGLSDSIIISKIKSSQTKFDTSSKALIGLKNAGMSDQVIEAVLNAGSASAAPAGAGAPAAPAAAGAPAGARPGAPAARAAPAPPAAAPAPAAARESIVHLVAGKSFEMVPANASM